MSPIVQCEASKHEFYPQFSLAHDYSTKNLQLEIASITCIFTITAQHAQRKMFHGICMDVWSFEMSGLQTARSTCHPN